MDINVSPDILMYSLLAWLVLFWSNRLVRKIGIGASAALASLVCNPVASAGKAELWASSGVSLFFKSDSCFAAQQIWGSVDRVSDCSDAVSYRMWAADAYSAAYVGMELKLNVAAKPGAR